MTRSEKSGTVLSTSSIKKAAENINNLLMDQNAIKNVKFYGTPPVIPDMLLASTHIPVVQNLSQEYEDIDSDYLMEVVELLSTYTDEETSDSNFEVCRLALENRITANEIYLIETMLENNLESLSKEGISIFEIDGGLDIRNRGGLDKQISSKEKLKLEDHLIGSSSYIQGEFLRVDKSKDLGPTLMKENPSFANREVSLSLDTEMDSEDIQELQEVW